jgi:hypothetical protein
VRRDRFARERYAAPKNLVDRRIVVTERAQGRMRQLVGCAGDRLGAGGEVGAMNVNEQLGPC